MPVLIILFLLPVGPAYIHIWNDREASRGLIDASQFLNVNGEKDDIVMSVAHPYIYYFSNKKSTYFPADPKDIEKAIQANKVKYILLNKFESGYPDYAFTYFTENQNFTKLKSFYQDGNPEAINVYSTNR